mmetsp:Transcript_26854/g.39781  ORF Transcript_26854/g.39781 Transcript_26854/m.39781 type:complete len:290 (-) Transcript_26854:254-1123(-)
MNNESRPSSHNADKKKTPIISVGNTHTNDFRSHRQDIGDTSPPLLNLRHHSEVNNKIREDLKSTKNNFQLTPDDMHHKREDGKAASRREDIISSQLKSVLTDASDDTSSILVVDPNGEKDYSTDGCCFLLFDSLSKTSRVKIEKRAQIEDDTETFPKEDMEKAYREQDIDALYKTAKSLMAITQEENRGLKNEFDQLKSSFASSRSSLKSELLLEENAQLKKQVKTLMEYIELRESDVQQGMSKMEKEMSLLVKDVNSRVSNVLRQTGTQTSRSKMLTAELGEATKKYS